MKSSLCGRYRKDDELRQACTTWQVPPGLSKAHKAIHRTYEPTRLIGALRACAINIGAVDTGSNRQALAAQ